MYSCGKVESVQNVVYTQDKGGNVSIHIFLPV